MSFTDANPPGANLSQDPRLQPTPDYGTLGPGSDAAQTLAPAPAQPQIVSQRAAPKSALAQLMVIAFGAFLAFTVSSLGRSGDFRSKVDQMFASRGNAVSS